jgi:DNA-binding NarL/FixJ family response regulator
MPQSETKAKSLLIVDDSELIVQRLTGILKEVKNIQALFTAADYQEALKIIIKKKPAIVLLDIHLAGKNGIDLLKLIVKEYPAIKVLMISNHASDYYQRLCKKIGAAGFIDKSKDFDLIPQLVELL